MVNCGKCGASLPAHLLNSQETQNCPACNKEIRTFVFPALFNSEMEGNSGEKIVIDSEAGCFYHPGKKAVLPCEECGRFLCSLCDVELNGKHVCPPCIESGKKKGKIKNLQNHRTLYDDIALSLAILPLLIWPFTLITAPLSLFFSIRYWKAPTSIIPRTKIRLVLAGLFSSLQIVGWILIFSNVIPDVF
ncbi:MAG: B-box zinc finger protein [Proteobacteria bacterium]|nr:B-box zinc finger protein [Pseudomonadota bacterium]